MRAHLSAPIYSPRAVRPLVVKNRCTLTLFGLCSNSRSHAVTISPSTMSASVKTRLMRHVRAPPSPEPGTAPRRIHLDPVPSSRLKSTKSSGFSSPFDRHSPRWVECQSDFWHCAEQ